MGPETAVFVPRGVGNGFQTLVDGTAYSYLVNEHWSAEAQTSYTFVNVADESLAIPWPLPLSEAELSEADRRHPALRDVTPVPLRRTLVVGAGGQLGRELVRLLPRADAASRADLDLAEPTSFDDVRWAAYDSVVNAAAYTAVDAAETDQGRRAAWAVNVAGVGRLADVARERGLTMVHVSSDYVFDGSRGTHPEDEPFSPLGVYGQTKAAGDALVATVPRHYVVRTSWVIGDGKNFVRTMADLADRGVDPDVIDDQRGRLTFAADLARGIVHLLRTRPPYGTYNLTSRGRVVSWADVAERVYASRGRRASDVRRLSTGEYAAGRPAAPRPRNSVLDLAKIETTGFTPLDLDDGLTAYLDALGTVD
jgi:dTDP-4-dehydrorhamnose 3,5-epimerase